MQTVSGKPSTSKALEDYCRDLCQQARDKSIDVVRSEERLCMASQVPAWCHTCLETLSSGEFPRNCTEAACKH